MASGLTYGVAVVVGGIEMKVALLEHEGAMREGFFRPARGTAPEGVEGTSQRWMGRR